MAEKDFNAAVASLLQQPHPCGGTFEQNVLAKKAAEHPSLIRQRKEAEVANTVRYLDTKDTCLKLCLNVVDYVPLTPVKTPI